MNIQGTLVSSGQEMLQSVKDYASSAYESVPKFSIAKPSEMVKNLQKVAIPAILLLGATNVQGADALGTLGCVICLASGVALPACIIPCGIAIITAPAPLF